MNKELNYDTHNDSIIRSMSAAPKMKAQPDEIWHTTNHR